MLSRFAGRAAQTPAGTVFRSSFVKRYEIFSAHAANHTDIYIRRLVQTPGGTLWRRDSVQRLGAKTAPNAMPDSDQ